MVEPIGTITKYFPFLKDKTKDVLKSIMDEAANYYDFVIRLRLLNQLSEAVKYQPEISDISIAVETNSIK